MRSAELRKDARRGGPATHFAQSERHALCDLLLEVGPDAPTLCSAWSTSDLAAHLVVRERRPDSLPGHVVSALAAHSEKVRVAARDRRGWEELVGLIRSGPPAPLRLVDEPFNTVEFFVHHEDVRRATPRWEPRAIDPEEHEALWGRLNVMGRLLTRRSPVGVVGESPGFGYMPMKAGSPLVVLRGAPAELVLAVFGRASHAEIEFEGDDLSIERLKHASLGV